MNYDLDTPEGVENSKNWTAAHLARLKDGETWIVPRSGAVVTINHTTKTASVMHGPRGIEYDVVRVLEALGYEVGEGYHVQL